MRSHIKRLSIISFLLHLVLITTANAETRLYRYPLVDMPFNLHGGPSMQQSLHLSTNFYNLAHNSLSDSMVDGRLQGVQPRWREPVLALFDVVSLYSPLGIGWLHEEWHRSVMTRRDIASYNGIYDFNLFASVVPVRDVLDADLVRLKADHPADMVRLHSAGLEAQYEMNLLMEQDLFFNRHGRDNGLILILNHVNNIYYMYMCSSDTGTRLSDQELDSSSTDISLRDFTGLDCAAWVYDLFRPDEPYAARGPHPSGVGIDRYRTLDDLTGAEARYLRMQTGLSLLNLLDPFLVGKRAYQAGHWQWNANLRHHLTPFGFNLGANLFLQRNQLNLLATTNSFTNRETTLPGLDLRLVRYPLTLLTKPVLLDARLAGWYQPRNLLYRDSHWRPGGLASLRVTLPDDDSPAEVYVESSAKSHGWVAGHDYLDANYSIQLGMSWVLRR